MNAKAALAWLRTLRPAITTVVILGLLAGLMQTVGRTPSAILSEPPAFTILPQGEDVSRLGPVTVTFEKTPEERAPDALFQVVPETKGTYAWLGARTALFQPDFPGFVRGSTYTVNVPARPDAGLASAISKRFTVTGQLSVQQTIPGDGDTEVPLAAQLFVQFSRSVAPLTTLSAQRADPVVTFEPALHGTGEWLNTSIYRFLPTDLAPATTYRLKVAKGLTSAADGVLQQDWSATFTTIMPAVDSIQPDTNWIYCGPWQQVDVTFNQAMDPASQAGFSIRNAETSAIPPGTLKWNDARTVLSWNPSERLGVQTRYQVTLDKGLKGARGGISANPRTSTFVTIAQPSVANTSPANGDQNAQRFGIRINFATPMDPATLEDKVRVSGFSAADLEGNVYPSEQGLTVSVPLKSSTAYTANLLPGATDRYGQAMGGYQFSFTTGAPLPSVSLALPGYGSSAVYSSSAEPILYFQATNVPSVEFTLWPLTADEGRRVMHDPGAGAPAQFKPSLPVLRTWTETVRGAKDEVLLGSTSLSGGRGALAKGYYYLVTSGQYASYVAFAVVDTVLVTKLSNDELLVWALDHDTGAPLQGVNVRGSGPALEPSEMRTDASGLASFKVPLPLLGGSTDRSYILWIDGGGRNAVTSTRWPSMNAYQFSLPGDYYAREWVGHLYTDRPIYRPGETVQWKGVVRGDDDATYSVPRADATFLVAILNARGQQVRQDEVKPNEFGSFSGSLELPSDAPTGNYVVNIMYTRGTQWSVASNSFLVAEFRKPEFEVTVTSGLTSYVNGDTIDAKATASFFFGGAVAGAGLEWSALADPYTLRVPGYEYFSFNDFDYATPYVARDALRAKGTAKTDQNGVASFGVPASLATSEGAQRFTLGAAVQDQNGQVVAGSSTVTVHPASLYAGIRPAQYVANEGANARIDLVTVDTDGKILPDRAVTVRVYDRQWITTKEVIPGGGRRYRSDVKDTLVATLSARTDAKGEGAVFYRPTKSGSLRLVAEVTDAKGRTSRSATFLWVWGTSRALWQVTNDDAVKLVADKERYEIGDTAEVLVPAPFPGAQALITIERGKIKTREVRKFATNSERLRIPITDASVPDIFVSVVMYWPPTSTDPIPRYKVGYVELPVSTATRVLNVSIRPDRDQAKPGDTVRYDIKVTDKAGNGVRSEVSVAVVDKAVLSLQDERGPDGLRAFWFERGLSVTTGSSMAVSINRWNDVIAEAPKQGKGGSGLVGQQVRQDFRNTAYWSAQVLTKADGTASVDVKMPDNLTTWRMQARAISGDTMVGEGTNELLATQPLLLRPALPRALRVGDSVELRALVRNATKSDAAVTVTLKAEGVTVTGSLGRNITVHPSESVIVSWPAKVEFEGTAKLRFTATGPGDLSDAIEQQLPVLIDMTPETTATGGIVTKDGQLEALYLPTFADTKHGSLSVSVQSALTGSMADELKSLEPYVYENAEYVASRLIATLAVKRAEKSAGVASTRDGRIATDVAGLIGRQRPDGGWAWCEQPLCQTDPNVTGWALIALGEAQRDGLSVDSGVIRRATGYVIGYVNRSTDIAHPADINQKAFLLYALAAAGGRDAALVPARALFEQQRAQLGNWGRAYLLLALTESGVAGDDAQVGALFNDLAGATIPSANGNHWEDAADKRGSFLTSTATTALATLAIARIRPDHALVPQTVRWLVIGRGANGWHSSVDRAMGVLALSSYAVSTGELAGDFSYAVELDAKDILSGLVKPNTTPTTATKAVPLSLFKPGTTSFLAFTRDYQRPGRLYYTLDLRYMTPAKGIDALNRGFAVSHQYTLLDAPTKPITSAKLGETVRVTVTVMVQSDHSYVVVEDPLPAGLEPVDARLKNVDPALKNKLDNDLAAAAQKQFGGDAYFAPWYRWYYSPWHQVELRDDRAVLSTTRLSKGIYEYVYYARATTPGDFFVAPAHAEET
ncbi:MAG: Ig-like domain-containing protein, partial [Chloroflexota bacterium]